MAAIDKKKLESLEGYNPKMYRNMKVVYIVLSILNLIVVWISFGLVGFSLYDADSAYTCISRVESQLLTSETYVLNMALNVQTTPEQIAKVREIFIEMDATKLEFDDLSNVDDNVAQKFATAYNSINQYRRVLSTFATDYEAAAGDAELLAEYQKGLFQGYKSEVEPLMQNAMAEMDEAVEQQQKLTTDIFFRTAKSFLLVIAFLILVMAVGIAAIVHMQKVAIRSALELKKKADEVAATERKLDQSRDKTKEIAFLNVLTNLKNRYALDDDLDERLAKENFHISNFDFDNFRSLNESYGRNFGDAFLSTIAEKLKNTFGKYAEIYNITSDEFAFVFKPNISQAQAVSMTQHIFELLSNVHIINGTAVQLPVSGCSYHYLAGECANLNVLLNKMDAAMHEAKSHGGRAVVEVSNL